MLFRSRCTRSSFVKRSPRSAESWAKRTRMMTTLAAVPEGVLLKKQYLKPILSAVMAAERPLSVRAFYEIVKQCIDSGLIDGEAIAADGSNIPANVSRESWINVEIETVISITAANAASGI